MTFTFKFPTAILGGSSLLLLSMTFSEDLPVLFSHYAKSIIDRVASSIFQSKVDLATSEFTEEAFEKNNVEATTENGSTPALPKATFDGHILNEIPSLSIKDMEMLQSLQYSEDSGTEWTYHPYNGTCQ